MSSDFNQLTISNQAWLECLLDDYLQNLCKFENHAVIKLKKKQMRKY